MSQRWQEPTAINGFSAVTSVVDPSEQVRTLQAAEPAWHGEAIQDRARAIDLIQDARDVVRNLRLSLESLDSRLAYKLVPFEAELVERLGSLLVAKADQERGR